MVLDVLVYEGVDEEVAVVVALEEEGNNIKINGSPKLSLITVSRQNMEETSPFLFRRGKQLTEVFSPQNRTSKRD